MTSLKDRTEYRKEYYKKNKEYYLEKANSWRKANPEKHREASRKSAKQHKDTKENYLLNNYEQHLVYRARRNAYKASVLFNLTIEDISIPEVCPYLQVPITRIQGQGRQDYNPSIDRIDPTKGYIKGNIQIISDKANRTKNNASVKELLQFADSIYKLHGEHIEETKKINPLGST